MAYGLKYSQYITRGGATLQIRVYEKDYNGTAYGMAHITGAALQIIGGQSDPLTPIIKTAFSWSLADCWDEGATQEDGTTCVNALGEKCGQWEEFYTPDATKFRVELWAAATAAATPACIWTGYVTPDSWSENMIYRGSVTITARDMLGALQDKEFNLTGRVSILDIVQGALSACAAPMALSYVAGHFLVNSNGSSILSHTIAASTFSGETWQTAMEDTLESLGLVLRYNGRNGLILTPLRYVREDTLSGIHTLEFANRSGLRELAPALRSITETFDVDLVNIPAEDPAESQFAATGSNLTQVVVAHAAGGGTFTNTNYIPGYTITEAGGEGWSGGLASPRLGTPIDGAPDRRMYFPTDVQDDVTAVWNGPRLRGSFAFRLEQDGPIVWWTSSGKLSPFLGNNSIKQIELQVTTVVDNVTWYLSQSGSWGTTEHTIIYELGEEVSVPDSGGVGVKIVVKKVVSECSFPAYYALFVALNLVLEPTARGASVITEYKTTTEYDQQNNVTITRKPTIGSANFSGCVDFFENVLALGAAIAPDEWNWPGESSYYPLAVMIQAQVLCYHAAAASVFTGTALDKTANAALPFPGCAYNYYQRDCIQLSGTFDFAGGAVSQMNIREVYSWDSVWGASFAPEYTQKSGSGAGSTSATGSGGGAANSGGGGYAPGGGTAYWEMGENTACVQLKPAYDYVGARKGLIFGRNAAADVNVDLEVVNIAAQGETPRYALHTSLPFVSDDFVSAGGLSTGGGAAGIDAEAMWRLLAADTAEQISASHLQTAFGTLNLGAAATYGIGQVASGDNGLVTGGAVWAAIDAMPEPMIFKGSLGTGGTITSLPAASAANEGFVYKVITAGTYRGITAKVGDTLISNGSSWILIPSGDEPSGTVTSVGVSVPTGFSVSGTPVTSSGTIAISFASGYSLPTTAKQTNWDTVAGYFDANGKITTAHLPDLYIGDAKVKSSAQTAQNVGGLGHLTIANDCSIRWLTKPAAGAEAQIVSALGFSANNNLNIGHGTAAHGNTYINGKVLYLRYGTSRTNGIKIGGEENEVVGITAYLDVIPSANITRNLGSESAMWKYTYTKRLYLAADTYIEIDASGHVHLVTPSGKGFYCDGFVSAGGLSSSGGSTGIDALAMWKLLTNDQSLSSYDDNTKIAAAHIPDVAAAYNYVKSADISDMATKTWVTSQNYSTAANTVSNVAVGGTGHTDELAITKNGSTSYLTVPYATNVKRFKRYVGTAESGGYDLNTLLSGGGITSQYNASSYWGNRPDTMSFGGVLQINPQASNSLAMQLAWDVVHDATTQTYKTGKLWWRDATYHDGAADWGAWHLIYDDATLTKSVLTGLLDAGNGTYVKLNPGSAEQTISSNINTFEKGVINLWRKSGDHFTFLGFSNGTTETYLGGIGFKSQSDHNLYRKDGSNYYKIWDASNANLSTVDWAAKDLTAAGALSVTGAASVNKLTIASTAGEAHIAFGRGGYNYITTPASGVLNIVTGGRSLSLANSTAVFTDTDVRPGANATYSLGTGSYCWEGIYGRYLELRKPGGSSLVFRGTTTLNNQTHTILFKGGTDDDSNGFKIETVPATSYGRQGLGFFTSNVTSGSAPYSPDWKRSLYISHGGTVYVGATDHANRLVVYGTATIGTATATSGAALTVSGAIYASTGIWSDGYVSAGGLSSSSDARLKKNIKDFEYSAELLMSLKPREWDWNGKATMKGHAAGFVAQEVRPLLPYAVREANYLQIVYETFHAIEVEGLQDHEARIRALERENNELKKRLEQYELGRN